ncbi:MAG: hypothetical protein ABIQ60_17055 [Burkholderiaceae bacterium]
MAIKLRRIGAGIAVVLAILASATTARDAVAADESAAPAPAAHGPLDGMSFVDKIGLKGNRDLEDELHFAAGRFWSVNCVACGYQPGPYWSRKVGDSIEFDGALESGGGGKFDYRGRVVGGQVDVRIIWTQQRWYGDIERELEFVGALVPAGPQPGLPALASGGSSDSKAQCRRL